MNRRKIRGILGIFLATALLLSCIPMAFGAFAAAGDAHVVASWANATTASAQEVALDVGDSLYILLDPNTTNAGGRWTQFASDVTVSLAGAEKAKFANSGYENNTSEVQIHNGFTFAYSTTSVTKWTAAEDKSTLLIEGLTTNVKYVTSPVSGWGLYTNATGDGDPVLIGGHGTCHAMQAQVTADTIYRPVLKYTADAKGTYTVSLGTIETLNDATIYLLSDGCLHQNKTPVAYTANDATCVTYGYTGDYTCDDCEAELSGQVIPLEAHNYVNGLCSFCHDSQADPKIEDIKGEKTVDWHGREYAAKDNPDGDRYVYWNSEDMRTIFEDVGSISLKAGEKMYVVLDPVNAEGELNAPGHLGLEAYIDIYNTNSGNPIATTLGANPSNGSIAFKFSYSNVSDLTEDNAADLLLQNLGPAVTNMVGYRYDNLQAHAPVDAAIAGSDAGFVTLGHRGALVTAVTDTVYIRPVVEFTAPEDGDYTVKIQHAKFYGDQPYEADWGTLDSADNNSIKVSELTSTVTAYLLTGHVCAENAELNVTTAATCGASGTGDLVCTICDATVAEGVTIPATGEHNFTSGGETCDNDNCDAQNPNYNPPAPSTPEGYAAAINGPDEAVKGNDTVAIKVDVTKTGDTQFSSAELTIRYDPTRLTYNNNSVTGLGAQGQVDTQTPGKLVISDSGDSKNLGTGVYTINFKAIAATNGPVTTTVTLVDAKFSTPDDAEKDNLTQAYITISDASFIINPADYAVTLPEGEKFRGAPQAAYGENYTFSYPNSAYYTFDFEGTTMGDKEVGNLVKTNEDGEFVIENVTGPLVIKAEVTANTYDVTINGKTEANDGPKATYGTPYQFTLLADVPATTQKGHTYTLDSIKTEDGEDVHWTKDGLTYTIDGGDITANIVITITETELDEGQFTVNVDGEGADQVTTDAANGVVNKDGSVTLTLTPEKGYVYTITVDGVVVKLTNNQYTINNVTANVTITVDREVDIDSATATPYLQMNGSTMYLITIGDTIGGKVYQYKGEAMYWSEKYSEDEEYGAYCFLVVVKKGESAPVPTADDFTIVTSDDVIEVDYTGNVNMSSMVDTNDAQLVYNMYNTETEYNGFTDNVTMEKFLCADVNGSGEVNLEDANAIVYTVLNRLANEE